MTRKKVAGINTDLFTNILDGQLFWRHGILFLNSLTQQQKSQFIIILLPLSYYKDPKRQALEFVL